MSQISSLDTHKVLNDLTTLYVMLIEKIQQEEIAYDKLTEWDITYKLSHEELISNINKNYTAIATYLGMTNKVHNIEILNNKHNVRIFNDFIIILKATIINSLLNKMIKEVLVDDSITQYTIDYNEYRGYAKELTTKLQLKNANKDIIFEDILVSNIVNNSTINFKFSNIYYSTIYLKGDCHLNTFENCEINILDKTILKGCRFENCKIINNSNSKIYIYDYEPTQKVSIFTNCTLDANTINSLYTMDEVKIIL